ncbi:signal peptidase I [Streptomyces xiamenensis]
MAVGARSGADDPEESPVSPGGGASGEEPPGDGPDSEGQGKGGYQPGDGESTPAPGKKQRSFWKELPILIGIAIVLALLIKTFLVQAFSIPSNSMQNTLQRGDRVLVDKLTPWFGSTPERGEVVVFNDPGGWLGESPEQSGFGAAVQQGLSWIGLMPSAEDQDLIKRVIAVGGDTVSCRRGGPVILNGKELDESEYLFPGNTACDDQEFGPITIPDGELWVMGDHRQDSLDSRYHQNLPGGGTVPESKVVGRAIVVAWPVNRWSTLPVPSSYDDIPSAAMATAVAAAAGPAGLGLALALPLVLWRRRTLLRKEESAQR